MKKVALILLLFYAKPLSAQTWYLGAEGGATAYTFRQIPDYSGGSDLTAGLYTDYIFIDNAFCYEGNLLYDPAGPRFTEFNYVNQEATIINYFSFNILHKYNRVSLQLKAGLFYTHYFSDYVSPENDFGPAFAINLSYKISKMAYLGLEFSKLYGISYFANPAILPENYESLYGTFPAANLNYTILSIKYIHKI